MGKVDDIHEAEYDAYARGHKEYKHDELVTILWAQDFDESTINNAIYRLVQQGRLTKPRYGYFAKSF